LKPFVAWLCVVIDSPQRINAIVWLRFILFYCYFFGDWAISFLFDFLLDIHYAISIIHL